MTSDEIRELFLSYFERARAPAAALRAARAPQRPSTLLISAGMHPLKPYFLGQEQPPHERLTTCQKCFRTAGHRPDRPHLPPPHVLRDARQLLDGRLLQAGRRRVRVGVLARGLRLRARADLGHGLRGRRGPRARARRGGHRGLAVGRRAARAHRPAAALGELLAGRPDRAVRAVLGALLRPRPGVRRAGRPAGRRQRALPGVLEPRLHAVRPGRAGDAHPAAGPEHRHGPGPQPPRGDHAGHHVGLRDGPDAPAHRPRGGALGPDLRLGRRHGPRAAHPRRPHPRDVLPHRGRRRALQRGARLRPAAPHAPRDRPGPAHRDRARLPAALRRGGARHDGRGLPRAPRAPDLDRALARVARRRASGARSSRAPGCSTTSSRGRRRAGRRASAPRTPSGCTTPTASRSTSRSSSPRSRASASTSRASSR